MRLAPLEYGIFAQGYRHPSSSYQQSASGLATGYRINVALIAIKLVVDGSEKDRLAEQQRGASMAFYKLSSKGKGAKVANCILVLWGEHFDEAAATIFTVTLRQAGLCVKVVGVNGLLAAGRNGLVLHADLALSEVMAWLQDTFCLVLPCSQAAVKRMENDPRIHEIFVGAAQNGAKFVVQDQCVVRNSTLHLRTIPRQNIVTYAKVENLIALAKEVANALLQAEPAIPTPYASATVE